MMQRSPVVTLSKRYSSLTKALLIAFILACFSLINDMCWLNFSYIMPSPIDNNAPAHETKRQTVEKRRVWTVFSTSCNVKSDWLSQSLLYSHQRRGIEGELVRLLSCADENYITPESSYSKYRVVRTPDFNTKKYSPRNKPWAVYYWLSGQLNNETDIIPQSDDVINLIDPDFLFLTQLNYSGIEKGKTAIAGRYGMGGRFVKDMAPALCDGHCGNLTNNLSELNRRYSYGAPYMMFAEDMLHYTSIWKDLVDLAREVYPTNWIVEMYAAVFAGIRLGIDVKVAPLMVTNPKDATEPWNEISWYSHDHSPVQYFHFCQKIEAGGFSFNKHRYGKLDLRKCDRSQIFEAPTPKQLERIFSLHGSDLRDPSGGKAARSGWSVWNAYMPIRDSILAYYEEMCPTQITSGQK